jgi:hypothetical protein
MLTRVAGEREESLLAAPAGLTRRTRCSARPCRWPGGRLWRVPAGGEGAARAMARAAIKPAASLPLVIGTSRNSTRTPGEASSLSTLATPSRCTTPQLRRQQSTITCRHQPKWPNGYRYLAHLAGSFFIVRWRGRRSPPPGTGRGRLSRVTNPRASVLPIAAQSPWITLVTKRALSSLFNFCGAYARISSLGQACRRGSKRHRDTLVLADGTLGWKRRPWRSVWSACGPGRRRARR